MQILVIVVVVSLPALDLNKAKKALTQRAKKKIGISIEWLGNRFDKPIGFDALVTINNCIRLRLFHIACACSVIQALKLDGKKLHYAEEEEKKNAYGSNQCTISIHHKIIILIDLR